MSASPDYSEIRENTSTFVEEICGVEPFDYQADFIDADERHKVIASGRQVGKSRMCAWMGLHKAVTNAHTRVLITAPSQRQSSLLFQTLYSEIDQSGLSDSEWGIDRDTQTIIEFDNGSSIHCLPTGRDGNNIRGFTADMIIVDEAAFVADTIFEDILKPMTFATGGEMVLASTPYGKDSYYFDKFDQAEYSETWYKTQVSSYANPLIDEDDLEEYKVGKTEAQIEREVLGEFADDAGQFFATDDVRACTGDNPSQEASDSWLGVDIAGSGDARTTFFAVDDAGNVFINENYENMGVLEAAERIDTLDTLNDFTGIYVDRTAIGKGTVEALSNNPKINQKLTQIYFTSQKKAQIFQRLNAALQAHFLVLPDEKALRDELEAITASESSNGTLRLKARNNRNDDRVDALALACWGLPDFGENTHHNTSKEPSFSEYNAEPRSGSSIETQGAREASRRLSRNVGKTNKRAQNRHKQRKRRYNNT